VEIQKRKGVIAMQKASLTVSLVLLCSGVFAQQSTCVVVVDPQAAAGYYGSYGGFAGYFWSDELSEVAKQELEVALQRRGFLVLLNAGEVRPTQEELSLENSEWGRYGSGRNDFGYFAGAAEIFYVSAFTYGGRDVELSAQFREASPSVRLADLRVKVIVRRTNTKTREVPEIFEGEATKTLVKSVDVGVYSSNPWSRLFSSAIEAGLTSWQDAGRSATRAALENALRGVQAPQVLAPTAGPAAAPRFIYLALREEVSEGDRFGIWRGNTQVAEVAVEEILHDGRARTRVIWTKVQDLGRPGDTARPQTPTISVE